MKEIPYDRVQDIEITYAVGGFPIRNILHLVKVQTAGNSGVPELELRGLRDPEEFKERILAIKAGKLLRQSRVVGEVIVQANEEVMEAEEILERDRSVSLGYATKEAAGARRSSLGSRRSSLGSRRSSFGSRGSLGSKNSSRHSLRGPVGGPEEEEMKR